MGILLKLLFDEEKEHVSVLVVRCQPKYDYRKLDDQETSVVADFILPRGGTVTNSYSKVTHGRPCMHQVRLSASPTPSSSHFDVNVNFSKCRDNIPDAPLVTLKEVSSLISDNDAGERNENVLKTSLISIKNEKVEFHTEEDIGNADVEEQETEEVTTNNTDVSSLPEDDMVVDEYDTKLPGNQTYVVQSKVAEECALNQLLGEHQSNLIEPVDVVPCKRKRKADDVSTPEPVLVEQKKRGRPLLRLKKCDNGTLSEPKDNLQKNTETSSPKPKEEEERKKPERIYNTRCSTSSRAMVNVVPAQSQQSHKKGRKDDLANLSLDASDLATQLANRRSKCLLRKRAQRCLPDTKCFCCGEPEDLLYCEITTCPRGYHLACLKMTSLPTSPRWVCPCHICSKCKSYKRSALLKICSHPQCLLRYCLNDQSGNIYQEQDFTYSCKKHHFKKTINNDGDSKKENSAAARVNWSQKNDAGGTPSTSESLDLSKTNKHMDATVTDSESVYEISVPASSEALNELDTSVGTNCSNEEDNSDIEFFPVPAEVVIDLIDDD